MVSCYGKKCFYWLHNVCFCFWSPCFLLFNATVESAPCSRTIVNLTSGQQNENAGQVPVHKRSNAGTNSFWKILPMETWFIFFSFIYLNNKSGNWEVDDPTIGLHLNFVLPAGTSWYRLSQLYRIWEQLFGTSSSSSILLIRIKNSQERVWRVMLLAVVGEVRILALRLPLRLYPGGCWLFHLLSQRN